MPCKIRIKEQVVDDIKWRSETVLYKSFKEAEERARDINSTYGYNVVSFREEGDHIERRIHVPDEVIDMYYDSELKMERLTNANPQQEDAERAGEEYDEDYLLQLAWMPVSKASPDTMAKVKEAAKRMGIDIRKLSEYLKGNPDVTNSDINGLADTLHGIVAVAEGKENIALTEEMVHVATAILEQTNPILITEMISKISNFKIYQQTFDAYKNNAEYQLSNGKPDVRKIKMEAVGKLIAELIVNNSEGTTEFPELREEVNRSTVRTWWQKILNWFRSVFKKSDIDLFEKTAIQIMTENIGTVEDIASGERFLQTTASKGLSSAQLEIQKKVLDTANTVKKVESKEPVDPLFMDTEEASNWYEVQNANGVWEKVKKRVTDRVKAWYKEKFFGKAFTEEEKEFNELKRTLGIKFHKFMEEIYHRYFNDDGTKRTNALPYPSLSKADQEVYHKLENYFVDMIDSVSKNGKTPLVFSESILYDPKQGEAGTLDLFMVDEDGTAHVLDWKFMSISERSHDVPWFKKGAFNVQLGRYKDILRDVYGVKKFGMTRAIPILLRFEREDKQDKTSKLNFTGIKIGSVNVKEIDDLKLLPVAEKTESTGQAKLDEIIEKLNAVYNQISKTKAATESEREFKATRLNLLEEAIRRAQIQQDFSSLVDVISEIREEGKLIIDDYNLLYKDKSINSTEFTDRQLSDFAERLREYIAVTQVFGHVTDYIGDLIYDPKNPSGKKKKDKRNKLILERIKTRQDEIRISEMEIRKVAGEFADRFIGQRNREVDLLSPEAVINGVGSIFTGVADLPLASLRILYKLVTNAKGKASRDSFKDATELMAIRKRLAERGGDFRELTQTIYQKDDKKKIVNKLVYKYDEKFYDQLKNNALEGNRSIQWLKDNIDMAAYEKDYIPIMESNIEHLKAKYKYDRVLMTQLIKEERDKWDISRPDFNGWTNYIIRRNPKSKWFSKEYLNIKSDPDLLALYQYIEKINSRASEVGYIQNKVATTFLPFVRKTMAESLAWDIDKSGIMKWDNMMTSLAIDSSTVGYGAVNDLTGELEHSIPKYFTTDFTRKETGEVDTSDLSEELFKNLIMYTNHVNKYVYMSAVEGQLKLVKDIEEFKGHWVTSQIGKVDFSKQDKPVKEEGNEINFKLFDDFLRGVLYEQKYPLSDTDIELNTGVLSGIAKAINEVTGVKIFKPSDKPSSISLVKSIDMLNRGFQLKTLGLELVSGAVNAFGGNIQVMIQAGNYFTTGEFLSNETKLVGNKFKHDDEREMFVQMINTFMPLKDDPTYDLLRDAGMTTLTRTNFSDVLMMFMRQPEQHIEKSVFLSLLQNMMIVDGKIVSIREHVKAKYPNRYKSSAEYHETKDKIDQEIEELKKTKSIDATKQLVDGKLVIPGLDLNNQNEIQRLTSLTRRISRHATGGIADSDINKASMSIWLRSVMVFKMWIPKLLSTRFSHFERTSDDFSTTITEDGKSLGDKYDIGRIRLWWYTMMTSIRDKSMNVLNILEMNEKGLIALDKMYEEFALSYKQRTGKEMNMSKEDFNDMVIQNLRNQMRELAILVSVFSATLAMGAMKPPDDADKATKNAFRYMQRVLDKFKQEVSFFYNPVEFEKLLSGGTFPAIALVSDIIRFSKHAMMEWTGLDISDPTLTYDEVVEKAQPIKNLMKIFPVTKPALTWGASISSDFAEYFDITVPRGNVRR